jgi:hypothetical protein
MKKYTVGISGWISVTVEAENEEQAEELALETEVGGELYDAIIEDVIEVTE